MQIKAYRLLNVETKILCVVQLLMSQTSNGNTERHLDPSLSTGYPESDFPGFLFSFTNRMSEALQLRPRAL